MKKFSAAALAVIVLSAIPAFAGGTQGKMLAPGETGPASAAFVDVVSLVPSLGISESTGDVSPGATITWRGIGITGFAGGEKTNGNRISGGAALRISATELIFSVRPDLAQYNAFPGLSTYLEIGGHHVGGQGNYGRVSGGGGLSYSQKLPAKTGIDGIRVEFGYHTCRGLVAGAGITF